MAEFLAFAACVVSFGVGYLAGVRHQARVDEQFVTRRRW